MFILNNESNYQYNYIYYIVIYIICLTDTISVPILLQCPSLYQSPTAPNHSSGSKNMYTSTVTDGSVGSDLRSKRNSECVAHLRQHTAPLLETQVFRPPKLCNDKNFFSVKMRPFTTLRNLYNSVTLLVYLLAIRLFCAKTTCSPIALLTQLCQKHLHKQ